MVNAVSSKHGGGFLLRFRNIWVLKIIIMKKKSYHELIQK